METEQGLDDNTKKKQSDVLYPSADEAQILIEDEKGLRNLKNKAVEILSEDSPHNLFRLFGAMFYGMQVIIGFGVSLYILYLISSFLWNLHLK